MTGNFVQTLQMEANTSALEIAEIVFQICHELVMYTVSLLSDNVVQKSS